MGRQEAATIEMLDGAVARLEVRRGSWLVGRGPDADLRVHSDHVSTRHAWVRRDARGTWVSDAGSRNGTWVNGQRLAAREARLLRDGDQLSFGPIGAVYSDAAGVPQDFGVSLGEVTAGTVNDAGRAIVVAGLLVLLGGFGIWASGTVGFVKDIPLGLVLAGLGGVVTLSGTVLSKGPRRRR
ncbi:hypothetical protein GCM10027258_32640 [Amycolatopsis stemonae]